jgi:GH15 family glucan-1,4-alpha-glucosidase
MITKSIQMLEHLRHPNGLFVAAPSGGTGYGKAAWIRDNVYEAMGLEAAGRNVLKTYHSLLDILLRHEYKIDYAIREKPRHKYQYIHARYDPETGNEFWDEWGNKQNDAIGALLFKIGDLESRGTRLIRDENDLRIVQKLVLYLESVRYWEDADNGIWEKEEEVHASSIGACVAGLKKVSGLVSVKPSLIRKGTDALGEILPYETPEGKVDLALLSLIYPYDIVSARQKRQILRLVESRLVRKMGVIRHRGDYYYRNESGEAEWTFGFPWLAIIYGQMGDYRKHSEYVKKTLMVMNEKGELPELYYAGTQEHNENSPLGWAQAMYLIMVNS